jgi:TPR repeat protein
MRQLAVLLRQKVGARWLAWGLVACTRVAPSTAPLSVATATPEPVALGTTSSAPSAPPAGPAKPPSPQGKRALYLRSCDLGSAVGCNDLAILLGLDSAEAGPLFDRACKLGLVRGCANQAAQLLMHDPDASTRERAVDLLARACDAAVWYGCAGLGDALYTASKQNGAGVLGRAKAAYEKACGLGAMDGCISEAWMLQNGEGGSKDADGARRLFRQACDAQSYNGCGALGFSLMQDARNAEDFGEGARLAKLACDHDDAFGCFALGSGMVSSGDPKALAPGLSLLKRSCQLGLASSCRFAASVEERIKAGTASPKPTGNAPHGAADGKTDADENGD